MTVAPGDLLATRSSGWAAFLIRLGSLFKDQVVLANHIAIVHHTDDTGTLWCIEGRPGGVGWRDATAYLQSPYTVCNASQPKTEAQRKTVCDGAQALLGTAYDWQAIAHDAAGAVGVNLWELRWPKTGVPGQVVCSTLADWLYGKAGLVNPAADREVSPSDWTELWIKKGWASRPDS